MTPKIPTSSQSLLRPNDRLWHGGNCRQPQSHPDGEAITDPFCDQALEVVQLIEIGHSTASLFTRNGNQNFMTRLCDEVLNGEISYLLRDAQILIKRWRQHYNTVRLYSAFGYFSPCAREHHTSRPKSHYELTFNMDHLIGALQTWVFVPKV